jgi:cation diffusion facilitator CzcD-associated flavoprotein CzcO
MTNPDPLDVVVIGAGIAGVVALHYARRAGLSTVALERQSVVGGLWAKLPAWQDIQNSRHDWSLADLPMDGEDAASVAANIRAWVDRFALAPHIRLDCPVLRATPTEDGWRITTPERDYVARHLIAATGVHNRPFVPPIERRAVSLRECHSADLHDPTAISGRHVVVVGGGASAYDLLELCVEHAAARITWVYRTLKWMTPTRKPKHLAADLRGLARMQWDGMPVAEMSRRIHDDLHARYEKFGIAAIRPDDTFDLRRHQLIPGRRRMIEHFERIERHRDEVVAVDGDSVRLASGKAFDVDLVLWGTGYELDLDCLDVPALAGVRRGEDLARRCGTLFVSRDAPRLYFPAPSLLESTSVSPWAFAIAARTIVSHIVGHTTLDDTPIEDKLSFFELAGFLASRDPASFPPGWQDSYRGAFVDRPTECPLPIP